MPYSERSILETKFNAQFFCMRPSLGSVAPGTLTPNPDQEGSPEPISWDPLKRDKDR